MSDAGPTAFSAIAQVPRYLCTEESIDPLCPSGENDKVVRSVYVDAYSREEAKNRYLFLYGTLPTRVELVARCSLLG